VFICSSLTQLFGFVTTVDRVPFCYRISDRGGGIAHEEIDKVWEYHYTTAGRTSRDTVIDNGSDDPFATIMAPPNQGPAAGAMFGWVQSCYLLSGHLPFIVDTVPFLNWNKSL